MKFLVTTSPISSSQSPNADILSAAKNWIDKHLEDGNLEVAYATLPRGGVLIADAETPEDLWDLLISYPLYQYLNIKVTSLVSHNHVFDKTIEFVADSQHSHHTE